ncbi:MAG TPA: nuclear transport factor 2 family protein [Pyrinomonadaceae bacterium]|nr:nuclear transport factor 2 family protein [Pyrinomonadaceae bacterium]
MGVRIMVALLLLSVGVVVQGQTPLQEMVKTEQAFSKMAEEQNTRDAFMTFIADDGLLFRPGAVNGKKWMNEHPVPPSDKKPLLAWQPSFAGIAASGDMGFTTGPWEARGDINDEKPSGYGHFVTVWKKQADGSWKFAVDLGISHPQSGGPQAHWEPPDAKMKETTKSVDLAISREALLERDRNYSAATLDRGLAKAFATYAASDVRLYRANNLPYIGRAASAEAIGKTKGQVTWQPIASDASRADDLGYTHGTYEVADDAKNVIERGSYVRIWKKKNGIWRIVVDVTNTH